MSDIDVRRPWFEWVKAIYWVIGAVFFLAGVGSTAFIRFTVYYLAEQSSISALKSLSEIGTATATHIASIDSQLQAINGTLLAQQNTNSNAAGSLRLLEDHAHALDARADADRESIASMPTDLATQNQQILFMLYPLWRHK